MEKMQITNTPGSYINITKFSFLENWSVAFLLDNKIAYQNHYKLIKIGSLLHKNKKKINLEEGYLYSRVTVRLYGKGVLQRDQEYGINIGTKSQFLIEEGQFIMSKIDARNGAFGIVPKELEGAIVTQDFLTYNIKKDIVLPDFFLLVTTTKQFHDLCQAASSGTTGRQRVNEQLFLNFSIPIPSLDIQQQIVDGYFKKIKEAEWQEAEVKRLKKRIEDYLFQTLSISINENRIPSKGVRFINYQDILEWGINKINILENHKSLEYPNISFQNKKDSLIALFRGKSPVYEEDSPQKILNQKCIRWNEIVLEYSKSVKKEWIKKIEKYFFTQEGDILINSTGEGTIGRSSVVTEEYTNLLYDSHILCLRVNKEIINPLFWVYLFNSRYGQKQIEDLKSAQSTKQTELGVSNVLKIQIPLPDIQSQNRIVHEISIINQNIKMLEVKALQNRKEALSQLEKTMFSE